MSHVTKPARPPGAGRRSPRASAKLRKLHEQGDINNRTENSHSPRRSHSRTQAATTIRPAGPADMAALSDFFSGLSAQTRYLRFFAPVTPTPAMLRVLSGCGARVD